MNHPVTHLSTIRPFRSNRERVSELLVRYPRLSEEEASEILQFLRTARHLDVGLLSRNDNLRPRLEAFIRDHQRHFRVNWREGVAVAGGVLVLLVTAWLIWAALAEAVSAFAETV